MSYTTSTPLRAPARRSRASAAQQSAELRVSHALATFARASLVVNKNNHHAMSELPARLARRVPAESRMTRDVAPARTRVETDHVLFIEVREFNDTALCARYAALALAQHRAECARARAAESNSASRRAM
jgi:hypothetical protein